MAQLIQFNEVEYWNAVAVYNLPAIALIAFATSGRVTLPDKSFIHDSTGEITDIIFPSQNYLDAVASIARRMFEFSKN